MVFLTYQCNCTAPSSESSNFLTLITSLCTLNILLSIIFTAIEQKWIREFGFSSYWRLALLEIVHLFVTIGNPLLPLFVMMDFVTRIAKTNLFSQEDNYACYLSALIFLQVCFGLAWPVWHNIVVLKRFNLSNTRIIDQMRFHAINYTIE